MFFLNLFSVHFSCWLMSDSLWAHGSSMPSLPVHQQLAEFTQIHVHRVGDAIQPSHPLSTTSPPAFNSSQHQGLFKWVNSSNQVAKVLELASASVLNIQDWFPLGWTGWISLQSKGISSLLQHHSSKASILWHSAFFIAQCSHTYITNGKIITLTRWTFVGKGMSLLFNMLSMWVIAFLPRRKHILSLWLQSPSEVILEPPPKKKSLSLFPHLFAKKWWDEMP